ASVVADLLGDQSFQLGAASGDEVLACRTKCEVVHLVGVFVAVVEDDVVVGEERVEIGGAVGFEEWEVPSECVSIGGVPAEEAALRPVRAAPPTSGARGDRGSALPCHARSAAKSPTSTSPLRLGTADEDGFPITHSPRSGTHPKEAGNVRRAVRAYRQFGIGRSRVADSPSRGWWFGGGHRAQRGQALRSSPLYPPMPVPSSHSVPTPTSPA